MICEQEQAKTPYYIESMGIRLYSMEELAYFLYQNIYLVDKRMLGVRLWDWIRTEIGNGELAERLKKGFEAGSSLQNMVLTILRSIHYYTPEELEQLYLRLAYPKKYWKIANHYCSSRKSWISGRDIEKLEKVIEQEVQRKQFLKMLFYFTS